MISNLKAKSIGRILIASAELDTKRGEYKKLQDILGESLYYKKGHKWYYNIDGLNNLTISRLNKLAEKIEKAL